MNGLCIPVARKKNCQLVKKNGKKRILILNWRDTKHVWAGGAEAYAHELAKRWVRMGHEVTLFCGNDKKSPRRETVDGVRVVRRGGFYLVYFWAFVYYVRYFRTACDVIVDSANGIPFFTPLYATQPKYLLIHHVHQEVFRKSLRPPFSWLAVFIEARIMPLVYRNTPLITISPASKGRYYRAPGLTKQDPAIVYGGVDTALYTPGKKSKHPLVLCLGRLKEYKSVPVFIRVAKKILQDMPSVEFVIAGDGEEKQALMALVKKLKLEKHITFTGAVTEQEKVRLYQRAWVFVNPSLMEGWGMTTIEANACGTPVVASNVGGLQRLGLQFA
jgi:glycosyltransferase involved in cell wall biosynthesis